MSCQQPVVRPLCLPLPAEPGEAGEQDDCHGHRDAQLVKPEPQDAHAQLECQDASQGHAQPPDDCQIDNGSQPLPATAPKHAKNYRDNAVACRAVQKLAALQ